jgi:hypothetical protein
VLKCDIIYIDFEITINEIKSLLMKTLLLMKKGEKIYGGK